MPKTKLVENIQTLFINKLKEILPPSYGIAEEVAEVLNVSTDSAYRRIRGETELTLDEIYKLSKKYAISIDEIFSNRNDTVTFSYTKLTDSEKNFESYLNRLLNHLKALNKVDSKKIFYVAEEIPMFYSFFSKKLTQFKLFYWQRSVLNISQYQHQKFEFGFVNSKLIDLAHDAFKEYLNIPSVEIWTNNTVLTNLKQIQFYYESGILNKEDALELLEEYKLMVNMVEANASSGRKNKSDPDETYMLYASEVVLGTNCIYVMMEQSRYSYISFNTLNSLTTSNPEFCEETEHWVKNLERKSTLISGVAEKQRYQFFSAMYKKIDECVLQIG
jgi:transcriptional regulator with XRE-family HTH domain